MKNVIERMKYWVDHDKMEVGFLVRDLVFCKLGSEHLKPLSDMSSGLLTVDYCFSLGIQY